MISDDDIKLCASALVQLFGKDAPVRAAERADEYLAKGENSGYEFWRKMMKATDELLQTEPERGEPNECGGHFFDR